MFDSECTICCVAGSAKCGIHNRQDLTDANESIRIQKEISKKIRSALIVPKQMMGNSQMKIKIDHSNGDVSIVSQIMNVSDDSDLDVWELNKFDKSFPLSVNLMSFNGGEAHKAMSFRKALLDFENVTFVVTGATVGTAFVLLTAATEIQAVDSAYFLYGGVNGISHATTAKEVELERIEVRNVERTIVEMVKSKWSGVDLEALKGEWLTVRDLSSMGITIK